MRLVRQSGVKLYMRKCACGCLCRSINGASSPVTSASCWRMSRPSLPSLPVFLNCRCHSAMILQPINTTMEYTSVRSYMGTAVVQLELPPPIKATWSIKQTGSMPWRINRLSIRVSAQAEGKWPEAVAALRDGCERILRDEMSAVRFLSQHLLNKQMVLFGRPFRRCHALSSKSRVQNNLYNLYCRAVASCCQYKAAHVRVLAMAYGMRLEAGLPLARVHCYYYLY